MTKIQNSKHAFNAWSNRILLSFVVGFLLLSALIPLYVYAQGGLVTCGGTGQNPCTICDIFVLLQNILNFLWWYISIPLATLMLAYAGFLLMIPSLGSGSPPMITKGKKVLKNTVVGIIIIFFSWLFIDTIIKVIAGQELGSGQGAAKIFGPWNEVECKVSATNTNQTSTRVIVTEGAEKAAILNTVISKQAINSIVFAQTAGWQASFYDSEQKLTNAPGFYWVAMVRMFFASNHDTALLSDFAQQALAEIDAVLADPNSNQMSRQIAFEARLIAQRSLRTLNFIKTQSAAADLAKNRSIKAATIASIVKTYVNFTPDSITEQKAKETALLLDGYPFAYANAVFSVPLPKTVGNDFVSILNSYKVAVQAQKTIIELAPALISRGDSNKNENLAAGLAALLALGGDGSGGDGSDSSGDADAGVGGGIGPSDADTGPGPGPDSAPNSPGDNAENTAPGPAGPDSAPNSPGDNAENTAPGPGPDSAPNSPGDNAENTANTTVAAVTTTVDAIAGLNTNPNNQDTNPSTDEDTMNDATVLSDMTNPNDVANLAASIGKTADAIAAGNPGNPAAAVGAGLANVGAEVAENAALDGNIGLAQAGLATANAGLAETIDAVSPANESGPEQGRE